MQERDETMGENRGKAGVLLWDFFPRIPRAPRVWDLLQKLHAIW